MGVRGLTTYINSNENAFLKSFFLHDSCLIIDGHSLCSQLYRRLNCFSAFGGDYDKYAAYVKTFFKNLRKCNITSYVIFDGSYEHRKLKTAFSRLRSKIQGASRLDPVKQWSLQIFPLLIRDVFIEVLRDMSIPYTVCEFEADDEIAAMARCLNCPVLSYDSDFFIYNVEYIPFKSMETKPKLLDEDSKVFALECKIYKVEYLTSHFGGLNEELLPLLATLLGNDYVEKKVFSKFFAELKIPKSKKMRNDQQKCIHGLFKWLQNETLESAISKIISRLKKGEKEKVLYIIKKSISAYRKKDCPSLKYFNLKHEVTPETILTFDFEIDNNNDTSSKQLDDNKQVITDAENSSADESNSGHKDIIQTEQRTLHTKSIPNWYAKKIRSNIIPKPYLNLYTHHLYFSSPQAEDYTDDDCFLPCLPILRFSFDILTDFSEDSMTYVSRERDLTYKRITVDREYSISRPLHVSLSELTDAQLKTYFFHFLKQRMELLDFNLIELLPGNFKLVMIAILWWVAHCSVPIGHVHSIFLSYIMLEVIDEKTGTFRGHHYFNKKFSKKLQEMAKVKPECNETELLNKNKVQYEDCMIAASVMLKHFELDDKIMKKPKSYDKKKMHSFAQFQCCLMQINALNSLSAHPFQSTNYCKTFNGTFVYNIAEKLEKQGDPYTFFKEYIKGASTVLMFYKSISKILDECVEKMKIGTVKWSESGKKRRRKKNAELAEINFIVKGFESEVVI